MASTSSNVAIRDKITMELLKILAKINYAMVSKDLGHATVEFTRGFYAGLRSNMFLTNRNSIRKIPSNCHAVIAPAFPPSSAGERRYWFYQEGNLWISIGRARAEVSKRMVAETDFAARKVTGHTVCNIAELIEGGSSNSSSRLYGLFQSQYSVLFRLEHCKSPIQSRPFSLSLYLFCRRLDCSSVPTTARELTRSKVLKGVVEADVSFDTPPPLEDIELLRKELENFASHPDHSRDFLPDVAVAMDDIGDKDTTEARNKAGDREPGCCYRRRHHRARCRHPGRCRHSTAPRRSLLAERTRSS
ncbi:Mechanosensitive ion channel family protein [Apiospora saccharicola]